MPIRNTGDALRRTGALFSVAEQRRQADEDFKKEQIAQDRIIGLRDLLVNARTQGLIDEESFANSMTQLETKLPGITEGLSGLQSKPAEPIKRNQVSLVDKSGKLLPGAAQEDTTTGQIFLNGQPVDLNKRGLTVVRRPGLEAESPTGLGIGSKKDQQKADVEVANISTNINQGGSLFKTLKEMDESGASFTGALADISKGVEGTIGQISPELAERLSVGISGATPEQLAEIQPQVKAYIASKVQAVTGEDSSRVSDRELEIARQAFPADGTFNTNRQAIAAMRHGLKMDLIQLEKQLFIAGKSQLGDLVSDDDKVFESAVIRHTRQLKQLGITDADFIEKYINDLIILHEQWGVLRDKGAFNAR